jgi:ketosteroid isomerase-like protein
MGSVLVGVELHGDLRMVDLGKQDDLIPRRTAQYGCPTDRRRFAAAAKYADSMISGGGDRERSPARAASAAEPDDDPDFATIRRAWSAFSRLDVEGFRRVVQPDVVAVPFGAAMEGRSYQGFEEILGWWHDEILVAWEWFEVVPEQFRRVGDRILVTGHWNTCGKESGIELKIAASWVIEVRDGRLAYWRTYTDHAQARRDIGLDADE